MKKIRKKQKNFKMPKNNAAKKGKKVGNKGKEPMGKKDKVAERPKVRL